MEEDQAEQYSSESTQGLSDPLLKNILYRLDQVEQSLQELRVQIGGPQASISKKQPTPPSSRPKNKVMDLQRYLTEVVHYTREHLRDFANCEGRSVL